MSIRKIGDRVKIYDLLKISHNPDLITLRNGQNSISRRSRAVKRLDIQTLIKVDGGSNPNSVIFFFWN